MDILAAFLDPADNGFDLLDVAQLVAVAAGVAGIMAGVLKWNSKRTGAKRAAERDRMAAEIKDAIEHATKPIQPGYKNGGESLADIAALARLMQERQRDIADDVTEVKVDLRDHIKHHPK